MYGAADYVQSLTTVCTPHHGMRLIDNCLRYPQRNLIENVDKVFEAVGLS
jgi:triacylglycerol esterase/lipase EstA (alpha/beta hydrolase family)